MYMYIRQGKHVPSQDNMETCHVCMFSYVFYNHYATLPRLLNKKKECPSNWDLLMGMTKPHIHNKCI